MGYNMRTTVENYDLFDIKKYYITPGYPKPVSYTHLDVYKRQFDKWANSVGNKTNFVKDDGSTPSIWAWESWHLSLIHI